MPAPKKLLVNYFPFPEPCAEPVEALSKDKENQLLAIVKPRTSTGSVSGLAILPTASKGNIVAFFATVE